MGAYFAHETALVESESIGEDTQIWAYTHVLKGGEVGCHCSIGDHCFVESGAKIGNYVTLKNGNMIWNGITLEDGVFVGPAAIFTNDLYPRSSRFPELQLANGDEREWLAQTVVKRGASIGAGSVIIAGINIGEFAMVGAGAVVTKDVRSYSLVIGSPARHYQWVCRCGIPLALQCALATCECCGRQYRQENESLRYLC